MSKLSEVKDVAPFQVLQKAKTPERKSKPARTKSVILVCLLSIFSTILIAFIIENIERMTADSKKRWKALIRRA